MQMAELLTINAEGTIMRPANCVDIFTYHNTCVDNKCLLVIPFTFHYYAQCTRARFCSKTPEPSVTNCSSFFFVVQDPAVMVIFSKSDIFYRAFPPAACLARLLKISRSLGKFAGSNFRNS